MMRSLPLPLLAGMWIAVLGGCGDAFSSHLPAEKQSVELLLSPDHAVIGETVDLHAMLLTPAEPSYISQYDLGEGFDVLYFDTGAGLGCDGVDTSELSESAAAAGSYVFAVCLTAVMSEDAPLGERRVSLDVESDGTPVVARGSLWVVPP